MKMFHFTSETIKPSALSRTILQVNKVYKHDTLSADIEVVTVKVLEMDKKSVRISLKIDALEIFLSSVTFKISFVITRCVLLQ